MKSKRKIIDWDKIFDEFEEHGFVRISDNKPIFKKGIEVKAHEL